MESFGFYENKTIQLKYWDFFFFLTKYETQSGILSTVKISKSVKVIWGENTSYV